MSCACASFVEMEEDVCKWPVEQGLSYNYITLAHHHPPPSLDFEVVIFLVT
jgi:hypothetical protein